MVFWISWETNIFSYKSCKTCLTWKARKNQEKIWLPIKHLVSQISVKTINLMHQFCLHKLFKIDVSEWSIGAPQWVLSTRTFALFHFSLGSLHVLVIILAMWGASCWPYHPVFVYASNFHSFQVFWIRVQKERWLRFISKRWHCATTTLSYDKFVLFVD